MNKIKAIKEIVEANETFVGMLARNAGNYYESRGRILENSINGIKAIMNLRDQKKYNKVKYNPV